MYKKIKTIISVSVLCVLFFMTYICWLNYKYVKIIAVHNNGDFSSVLVENFPYTDKGKITWWLKNKDNLQSKYHIPKPSSHDYFSITFWLFGDGYQERKGDDRYCFEDMPSSKNCIERNNVFRVDSDSQGRIHFTTSDRYYILQPNGEVVPSEYK